MTTDFDYSSADLLRELRKIGIVEGDSIFVHADLDRLGDAKDCPNQAQLAEMVFEALTAAVGPDGTILVPTYTFSFCKREVFDVRATKTRGGPWSASATFLEYFRQLPGAIRSIDPIHSVAGLGPKAEQLLTNLPNTCFGLDSVHERLMNAGGKICLIGVGLD